MEKWKEERNLDKSKVWRKGKEGRQNGMKASKKKGLLFFNVEGKVDRIKQRNGTKHIQNSPRKDTQQTKRSWQKTIHMNERPSERKKDGWQ
jgi:hypothetical protein